MNFCASGFMLAISGAGCPAATTTTSTDLSPISLTSASWFSRKLSFASGMGPLNIIRYRVCVIRAAPLQDASVDLCVLDVVRSEEHTSELQSLTNLVCRLLLEKKK